MDPSAPGPTGTQLGLLSVRLDAAYCAVAALVVVVFSAVIADEFGVDAGVVLAVAAVVGLWAAFLIVASFRAPLDLVLRLLLVVNGAATFVVAIAALVPSAVALQVALAVTAVEIAGFAVSQSLALRRLA